MPMRITAQQRMLKGVMGALTAMSPNRYVCFAHDDPPFVSFVFTVVLEQDRPDIRQTPLDQPLYI